VQQFFRHRVLVSVAQVDKASPWSTATTVAFRWFAIISFLFIAPIEPLTNLVIPWVGNTLLGIEGEIALQTTGSGDTMAEYIRLFLHVALGFGGAAIWTMLEGTRAQYTKLLDWLTFSLRLAVATAMLGYGMAKLVGGQFSPPDDMRMLQTFGDASPMGLLWTFMGHSAVYSGFTGVAELLGGVLLLSRRTATLGALIVVGVMANVVMLNFCYDVPVKLFSSRLLLWALFLVALDRRRLFAVFTNSGRCEPRIMAPLFQRPRLHLAGQVLKALMGLTLVLGVVLGPMAMRDGTAEQGTTGELQASYEVQSFERNGEPVPPLVTDDERWHRVIIASWDRFVVFATSGKRSFYKAKLEDDTLTLTTKHDGEDVVLEFSVVRTEDGLRLLGETIDVELKAYAPEFLLRDRGLHWVQEVPYNR
jgi:hypothetical protein